MYNNFNKHYIRYGPPRSWPWHKNKSAHATATPLQTFCCRVGEEAYYRRQIKCVSTRPTNTMTEKTSEQVYLGLVIAIPIFFSLNAVLAYIGGRWQKKLAHKTSEDVLTAHYLGGRSFGSWVSFGTLVSYVYTPSSYALYSLSNAWIYVCIRHSLPHLSLGLLLLVSNNMTDVLSHRAVIFR